MSFKEICGQIVFWIVTVTEKKKTNIHESNRINCKLQNLEWLSPSIFGKLISKKYHVALVVKNPPANAGDVRDAGLIPELGRSSGAGNGNPLQHSCLQSPMDRGAWRATVHRVAESDLTEVT